LADSITVVNGVYIDVNIDLVEVQPNNTTLLAQLMTVGTAGNWVEGDLDAGLPGKASGVSTYAFQYFASTPWPNNDPWPWPSTSLGGVILPANTGPQQVAIPIAASTFMGWLDLGIAASFGNGVLFHSAAAPHTLLVSSIEGGSLSGVATLKLDICHT